MQFWRRICGRGETKVFVTDQTLKIGWSLIKYHKSGQKEKTGTTQTCEDEVATRNDEGPSTSESSNSRSNTIVKPVRVTIIMPSQEVPGAKLGGSHSSSLKCDLSK